MLLVQFEDPMSILFNAKFVYALCGISYKLDVYSALVGYTFYHSVYSNVIGIYTGECCNSSWGECFDNGYDYKAEYFIFHITQNFASWNDRKITFLL